ncbi:S8 family serine peptidase [[Eubacterium] cellulosolvens]
MKTKYTKLGRDFLAHRCRSRKVIDCTISILILLSSVAGILPIFALASTSNDNNNLTQTTAQEIDNSPVDLPIGISGIGPGSANNPQIIQFTGPIQEGWKEEVTNLGVELLGYLPDFMFLAMLNFVPKETLIELPYITGIQPFLPEQKYAQELFNEIFKYKTSESMEIAVNLIRSGNNQNYLEDAEFISDILPKLGQLGVRIKSWSADKIIVEAKYNHLQKIAELDEVLWLEPVPDFKIQNDVSRGIIDIQPVWENLSLNGTGQVVTVCDTGLDNGSYSDLHEDFRGRLLHAYAIGRMNDWSDANIHNFWTGEGVGGHGTHVAGSILGAGNHSGGQFKGVAYNASLVFQSVMDNNGLFSVPSNLYQDLFWPPYSTYNSRIHSNSWGSETNPGEYSSEARAVDSFVWDYDDQIILLAAGNSASMVHSPSTAKNCITVGASESLRSATELPSHYTMCNNIDQRASFSCFGTTDDRLKPDIICPGTGILSTRSSEIDDVSEHYWAPYDAYYAYAGGTSMATPITAGVVTLIRQYYTDLEGIDPSAALVKATLLNGGLDMLPSAGTPPIPNMYEGWGRINLKNSILPELPGNLMYIDDSTGLVTNQNFTFTIEVLNNSVPLNITLVWSDYPASLPTSIALVNDLHLNVTHITSGLGYKGNVFSNGWSSTDDADADPDWDKSVPADGYDNRNNVEGVRLKQPALGRYKITVVGYNIPSGPQKFALAVTGGVNPKTLLPPSNIKVEAVPEGNALNITWEPVFGPTIQGYEIHRSTSPTSDFTLIHTTNSPDIQQHKDTGLTDGTTYYYKLRTKNIFNNLSNFSLPLPGVPKDSMAPWVAIMYPTPGVIINKEVVVQYENESDCKKIVFQYYNDTNSNGMDDDGNQWVIFGSDSNTELNGTFNWNTTAASSGPGNQPAIILALQASDEVPNSQRFTVSNLAVDNQAPGAPILQTYSPNPVNISDIRLNGVTEGEASVYIYSNDKIVGTNVTNETGIYYVDVELDEGMNAVTARAFDYLGNGPGPPSSEQGIVVDTVPPVADSGGNFRIIEDTWFTFNGSSSYDTNPVPGYNYISSYQWYFKLFNSTVKLLHGQEANYYFDTMGNYTITLSIRDSAQNLGIQKFWVLVRDNTTPDAVAGPDFEWDEDIPLFFDASNSTDNDPNFNTTANFTWRFRDYDLNKLDQGKIKYVTLNGRNVTYNFSSPGTYEINLTITDAAGNSANDSITVKIRDTEAPVAVATSDQLIVTLGRTATLSAHKSTDNDPTFPATGNFTWTFKYIEEDITLYGLKVKFRFQKINVFTITLTVRDQWDNSATNSINIQVATDPFLPTVQWTFPADNSTNVRVTTVIKIKLSERLDVVKVPINRTTFQLLDGFYRTLEGDLEYDPDESLILFIPKKVLNFGESYTVQLLGSLVDLAWNHLDGNGNGDLDPIYEDMYKIVFTTSNITTLPENYELDSPTDTAITARFSGNVSNWTILNTEVRVIEVNYNELVPGTFEIDLDNYTINFNPLSRLKENRYYQVNLTINFYLATPGNITPEAVHRELVNPPINLTNSTVPQGNLTQVLYTWTFRTEKVDEDGSDFGIFGGFMMFLVLVGVLIIIIVVIVAFLVFYQRKKAKENAGKKGTGRVGVSKDYEDEYLKVYGEYPEETQEQLAARRKGKIRCASHGPSRSRRRKAKAEKLRTARAVGRAKGKKRRHKTKPKDPPKPIHRGSFEPEPEFEEDWELEEEVVEFDEEEPEEAFDFEEEYITEFTEKEQGEGYEEEDEVEFQEIEELEEEEPELEEMKELEEMEELEVVEEIDEIEEMEDGELEDAEELEELDEVEEE